MRAIANLYKNKYKTLLVIPAALLVIAIILIFTQYARTGDFVYRDVTLRGGITLTISSSEQIDALEFQNHLTDSLGVDTSVRVWTRGGTPVGYIIDAAIDTTSQEIMNEQSDKLIDSVKERFPGITKKDYSVETIGSSLGESFFRETIRALIIAFLFMGCVVYLYFGERIKAKVLAVFLTIVASVTILVGKTIITDIISLIIGISLLYMYFKFNLPSIGVILAAVSDIIVTLAVVNLLGIKLSTAGIAALLMLVGYSVDTDILLTTKIIKRKIGNVYERTIGAMKTGLMMSATTLVAVIAALIISDSEVLKQIMIILLIGLLVDFINTWIQNAGILRWYMQAKGKE